MSQIEKIKDNNSIMSRSSGDTTSTAYGITTVEPKKLEEGRKTTTTQLSPAAKEENQPAYSVFSKNEKLLIVIICCLTGIVSPLSANIYFPALNVIQSDLHTSTGLINLTVTVYMVFQGLSPSFWGSLADLWGRRPVYLATLFVYMSSCIGLALSPTYWVLLVLRMLQAVGSSSVIAIGAGVVGDIATPAERGSYFGLFSMGQMLGTVSGPLLGGIISQYLSWRWIFWILLIVGGVFFAVIGVLFPETLRSLVGDGSGYANPTPWQWYKKHYCSSKVIVQEEKEEAYQDEDDSSTIAEHKTKSKFLQVPNITQPFLFLLEKDVTLALVYNGIHYATYYCYLTSTSSQFSLIYKLSEIQIGLCFLCQGMGCTLGSLVQGKLLDRDFRIVAAASSSKQGCDNVTLQDGRVSVDFPIFKARFRSLYLNAGLFQVITLLYGWMLFIRAPLAVVLFLQFIVGFANTSLFNIFQTLMVDLFAERSATITATNNLVRCLLGAVATVVIEPGIQGVGVGCMFTLLGCICVLSNVLVPVLLKMGSTWRSQRLDKLAHHVQQQDELEK